MLQRLTNDMKEAMKSKKQFRLDVIRMLIAEIKNEEKSTNKKRTPDEVVMSYYKKMQKAVEEYPDDKKGPLLNEIKIIEEYIPRMMTKEEIISFIKTNVTEVSIKTVMPLLKGKADGKIVKDILDNWKSV